jgi:hypothetical protein
MTLKAAILNTAPIVAAIRAAMPELVEVGDASSFGRLDQNSIRYPAAYVIPLAETPGANRYHSDAILNQRVLMRFGVIWSVRDIGDRLGTIASGEIKAVREAGMIAVCQFRPSGAEGACEPVGGKLVSGIGRTGQMLWQDDFAYPVNRHIPIVQGA